jgi:hypothetical protein
MAVSSLARRQRSLASLESPSNWQEQSNDAQRPSSTGAAVGADPQARSQTDRFPDAGKAGTEDRRAGISAPGQAKGGLKRACHRAGILSPCRICFALWPSTRVRHSSLPCHPAGGEFFVGRVHLSACCAHPRDGRARECCQEAKTRWCLNTCSAESRTNSRMRDLGYGGAYQVVSNSPKRGCWATSRTGRPAGRALATLRLGCGFNSVFPASAIGRAATFAPTDLA